MAYTFVEEINRGGFGVVDKVRDDKVQIWARKTFTPGPRLQYQEDVDKHRKRFIREVMYQRSLPDEYTIPVLDSSLTGDSPWYIMPLADKTYKQQILDDKAQGVLTPKPLAEVLNALAELHEMDFVHRDLKPENILLHEGKWKLADFGLVLPPTAGTTKLTSMYSAWGTEEYAAPEQFLDFSKATNAADIYSFGCILHDLVSDGVRVPYSQLTAPGPLGLIIEKCTERDPVRRFKSVRALRGALLTHFANPPTLRQSETTKEWLQALDSYREWDKEQTTAFGKYVSTEQDLTALWQVLQQLDEDFWQWLYHFDPDHAETIALPYTDWAKGAFSFDYCDVLVGRLELIFHLSPPTTKGAVAIAAACLGTYHNRWYVMRRLRTLCNQQLADHVARRIAIEIQANDAAGDFIGSLDGESLDDSFHPAICEVLR